MQTFNLSNEFEVRFEPKRYPVIVTTANFGTTQSGKEYIEHELKGEANQSFTKKFFLSSEGARKYYASFLASAGVKKTETVEWNPLSLIGRKLDIEFMIEEYDHYDDIGNKEVRSSLKIKRHGAFTGDEGIAACLDALLDDTEMSENTVEASDFEDAENPFK